jgi:succinate-semialdehyde dehydrogenase/glutarate-semialdehyde dehydrogenase
MQVFAPALARAWSAWHAMSVDYPALELVIAGSRIGAGERAISPVINPSTGASLGELPHATTADVDEAIDAAAKGFDRWRRISPLDRGRVLRRAAEGIRAQRERLGWLIASEMGKPVAEARRDADTAAEMFEWAAEEARRAYGRVIPPRTAGVRQLAIVEPVGPVAAFSGWNSPAITPSRKLSGALAAGCSVVIKPSEETPATALLIVGALEAAGLPPGVVNVLFGNPGEIAERLAGSEAIRQVTFTGATAVGKHLAEIGARTLKRMVMELGGHAPVVIFGDVDPEEVATTAVAAKYRNAGQICTSPTRFYVHESIHDRFVARFVEVARAWPVGDPFDDRTKMGPLANARRLEAMQAMTADARRHGVEIAVGGEHIEGRGFFYKPTLLANVDPRCLAANVEPFGPLAMTAPFRTFDEVVAAANRLPFGLAAYAFTRDAKTAIAISDALDSGCVVVNHWTVSLPETPFGGVKDSGFGHEGGVEGLTAFQKLKYVTQA